MRKLRTFSLIAATLFLAGQMSADVITLSGPEIASFVWTPSPLVSTANNVSGSNLNGFFNSIFDPGTPGLAVSAFRLSPLSIPFSNGDTFALLFTSNDLSLWSYEILITTGSPDFTVYDSSVGIAGGASSLVSVALGPSGTTIGDIFIIVGGTTPNTNNPDSIPDYAVDFRVQSAAVPEPATLSLVGVGLLGLGVFARRRARR